MGKASREKRERRDDAIALNSSDMPRRLRRALQRELAAAPTIEQIRAELARFSRRSVVEAAAASATAVPPILIGRVIRETVAGSEQGTAAMTPEQFVRVARRLQNVADPAAWELIGSARLHDVALTRVLTDSLPFNSRPHLSIHRAVSVLLDPVGPSLLDDAHWTARLGVPFKSLMLGSMFFHNRPPGPFDVARFHRQPMSSDTRQIVDAALRILATPLDTLTYTDRDGANDPYQLGPLASTPLLEVEPERVVIPSPAHVPLATSVPALYIRLAREDGRERTRTRTELAGHRFGQYLIDYARAGLPSESWHVVDLDAEPRPDGEVADLAIWPADRSFMVVIETKATLSRVGAMLGEPAERDRARELYQKCFDQISNTAESRGRDGFLTDAPASVPVFGFAVTVDLHLTSVIDDVTYFGLVLDYRPPGDPGVACASATARVISSDNAETLIDTLAIVTASEAHELLRAVASKPTPLTAVAMAIDECGLSERLAEAPVNPQVVRTLAGLTDGLSDPVLREWPQRVLNVLS